MSRNLVGVLVKNASEGKQRFPILVKQGTLNRTIVKISNP
jgi:hypothetical protein